MKTLNEMIKCVKRELGLRTAVYPRRVAEGRMTQGEADHQIECMRSILETLEAIHARKDPQLRLPE